MASSTIACGSPVPVGEPPAGPRPLGDQFALELPQGREDPEYKPSVRRRPVDLRAGARQHLQPPTTSRLRKSSTIATRCRKSRPSRSSFQTVRVLRAAAPSGRPRGTSWWSFLRDTAPRRSLRHAAGANQRIQLQVQELATPPSIPARSRSACLPPPAARLDRGDPTTLRCFPQRIF